MTPPAVASAVVALGRHLAGEPFRVPLEVPGRDVRLLVPRAIYFAYTGEGDLDYIGKVDRAAPGTAEGRLREHLRTSRRKRRVWRWLWVVPIADTLTPAQLLELERTLITLRSPPANVQHVRGACCTSSIRRVPTFRSVPDKEPRSD